MLTVINPTTGKVINEVPVDSADVVEARMAKAEEAYYDWKAKSFAERGKVLKDVAAYMREHVETLAPLMTQEMGKPIKEARGEVEKAAMCADYYADHAEGYLRRDVLPSDATESYVQYLPLGVILGILPWNAPFWLAFRFCAPALMAGNTCLLKHDSHVPACAQEIAECFTKAGAPEGLMQSLLLKNQEVEGVIRDRRVQAVSFTGSEKGGGIVASIAASEIKHSVLELGGSDPAIVLKEADLQEAASIISFMRIINAGQSCIAAKRIIIEDPVYDEMVALIQAELAKLKVGDPAQEETDIGPIAREDLRDNLHRQVETTVNQGARCLMGGELPKGDGFFYPVTLLADVTPDMCAAVEETFGPVAVLMKAKDPEDALRIANDSEYGLAGSIWGKREQCEALAVRLETGQVAINGLVKTDPKLPSGGIKRSGFGRELGPHGIHEFVNAQQVWVGPKQS